MSYITVEYYNEIFHGEPVDTTDFPSLSERASEIVEEMCMYRVSESNLAKYAEDIRERIKKAVCAQIEYMEANGGSDMDNSTDLQSATLGKFNYTKAADVSGGTVQSIYAPRAVRILAPTGLLYRGGAYY